MYLNKLEENWLWEEQSSNALGRLFHNLIELGKITILIRKNWSQ